MTLLKRRMKGHLGIQASDFNLIYVIVKMYPTRSFQNETKIKINSCYYWGFFYNLNNVYSISCSTKWFPVLFLSLSSSLL